MVTERGHRGCRPAAAVGSFSQCGWGDKEPGEEKDGSRGAGKRRKTEPKSPLLQVQSILRRKTPKGSFFSLKNK